MNINFPLEVSLLAVLIAQILKLPIRYYITKKWDFSLLLTTGGMPSSHSAFVSALTLALGLTEGIGSPLFAISFVLAGIVIHDAIGIRREAGKHATVLNDMKEEINDIFNELNKGKDKDIKVVDKRLKELLGHEPLEVLFGIMLGVVITFLAFYIYIA
jgi:acid phosphatase family membrane protein YuiD